MLGQGTKVPQASEHLSPGPQLLKAVRSAAHTQLESVCCNTRFRRPHLRPNAVNKTQLWQAMAPDSGTLAWKIPWTEEPGRLPSMGSLGVGHDWATSLLLFLLSSVGEGNGNPLQCSCLENPRDGRAWWAAVYGVAQSWTRLKRLSSSSSILR